MRPFDFSLCEIANSTHKFSFSIEMELHCLSTLERALEANKKRKSNLIN
jgi:hypothetical protein